MAITDITEDELEAFHATQREAGRAASTLNHQVQVIKAAFRWATRKGYVSRSPVSDGSSRKRSKIAKRHRRLFEDEEQALLRVATPRLYRIPWQTPVPMEHRPLCDVESEKTRKDRVQ